MPLRAIAITSLYFAILSLAGCTSDRNDQSAAAPDPAAAAEPNPNDSDSPESDATRSETDANMTDHATVATLQPVELATIRRAHVFGDEIYLTGQPSEDDFFAVREAGIKTVINQRHDRENAEFSEQQVVTDLGMTYLSLPFGAPTELTDELLDATRQQFRDAPKPMLIHCASANRTGATWLAFAVLDRGLTIDEALKEAEMVGLRTAALEDVVRDYIERRQNEE